MSLKLYLTPGDSPGAKYSRRQYACVAVLVVAVAALLADRLLLGSGTTGPNPATASTHAAVAGPAPAAPAVQVPAAKQTVTSPERPSLGERLAALAKARGVDPAASRDAFALQELWLSQLKKPAPEARPESRPESPPPSAPPAVFASKHKLTAVMMTGQGGSAIVDGKMLRMGQEVGGHKLIGLKASGRAVFQACDGGEEVELSILSSPR